MPNEIPKLNVDELGELLSSPPDLSYERTPTNVPLTQPDVNLFSALFFRDTTIGSILSSPRSTMFDPTKNMNTDFIKFVPDRHMNQLAAYALVTNDEEAFDVMQTLDEEGIRTAAIEGSPYKSFFYNFAVQPLDPVNALLPGGTIFKNVKNMSRIARSALEAGAAGVISGAAQEAIIQTQQLSRGADESLMSPIASGIFSAAIGGAASWMGPKTNILTDKVKTYAKKEILEVLTNQEKKLKPNGTLSPEDLNNMPKVVKKTMITSLMNRMVSNEEFDTPKTVANELFQSNYDLVKNQEGIPSLNVEADLKLHVQQAAKIANEYQQCFLRQAGIESGFFSDWKAAKAAQEDPSGHILNAQAFDRAVVESLINATPHQNAEVNNGVKLVKEKVFEPWKNRAIDVGLLPKGISTKNALDYFMVMWNRQRVIEDPEGFQAMSMGWFTKVNEVVKEISDSVPYQYIGQEIKTVKGLLRRAKANRDPKEARLITRKLANLEKQLRKTVKNVAKSPEYRSIEKEIATLKSDIRKASAEARKADVKAMSENLMEVKKKITQVKNSVKGFSKHGDYISMGLDIELSAMMVKDARREVIAKQKEVNRIRDSIATLQEKAKTTEDVDIKKALQLDIKLAKALIEKARAEVKSEQSKVDALKAKGAKLEQKRNTKARRVSEQTLREIEKHPDYKDLMLDVKTAREMINRAGTTPDNVRGMQKNLAELETNLKKAVREVDKSPEYKGILAQIADTKEKLVKKKAEFNREGVKAMREKLAELQLKLDETARKIGSRTLSPDEIEGIFHQTGTKRGRLRSYQTKEQLEAGVKQTTDRITGNDTSNLMSPILSQLDANPSQFKERTYLIPQRLAMDWQITDVNEIIERYVRTTAPAVLMTEKAIANGYLTIKDWHNARVDQLKAEFDVKKEGLTGKKAADLDKRFKQEKKNITDSFKLLLGIYGDGPNIHDGSAAKYYRAFLDWNYVRLLGFMTLSAIPDVGMHVLTHGPYATVYTGMRAVLGDMKSTLATMTKSDLHAIAYAMNTELGLRIKSMSGHEGLSNSPTFFGKLRKKMVDTYGNVTLMNHWNDGMQRVAGAMSINRTLKAIDDFVVRGTISQSELTRIARLTLDPRYFEAIHEMWVASGALKDGETYLANWTNWDANTPHKREALWAFQRSVASEIDSVVIVPGLGDKPLVTQHGLGKLILQFKSFAFAATNKILFAGIQRRHDQNTYFGMVAMLMFGAVSYIVTQLVRGNKAIDLSFETLAKESIDRSGLLGIVAEVYNLAGKAGIGFGSSVSRYQSRGLWGALLGPTTGAVEDILSVMGVMRKASGEDPLTQDDLAKTFRLFPYQNLFYINYLSRQMGGAIGSELGFEKKQKKDLQNLFTQ